MQGSNNQVLFRSKRRVAMYVYVYVSVVGGGGGGFACHVMDEAEGGGDRLCEFVGEEKEEEE